MSIRLRVALVFTVALAVAFALGSWLLLSQLGAQLVRTLDASLQAQLAPYQSAAAGSSLASKINNAPENALVQVIDPAGRVARISLEAPSAPMLRPADLRAARAGVIYLSARVEEEQIRLAAGPTAARDGTVIVFGESEQSQVSSTLSKQATILALAGVVFVLLGGLGAYWLARAALSPVERMRREVAALSERDTEGGVAVPKTRDELAALAGTMNDLLARLQGALARQRGFVADASHELRTPLAVLGAELELAGRPGRSRDELAQAAASAEAEVARLTRITNDLLVLARSDEGRLPVRAAPTDVRGLLANSVAAAAGRAKTAGVACVVDAPAGLVASLDADRVRQAVDNLIDNALRFAPRGSSVQVAARADGDALVIEVADSGPGFPAAFLPHAFERFRRPDSGRARSGGGAGLGLAIVATIAAAHGGSVSARNRPAGGAVVTLELPDAVAPAHSPAGA